MRKSGFKSFTPIEGDTPNLIPNSTKTIRIRLEPHQSLDFHKSFFNLRDTVPRVGDRADTDFVAFRPLLLDAHKTKCFVRADNHFINAIGTFRILINGVVVEEVTDTVGQLDTILKRLNNSSSYNILKDHQNFGNEYMTRYLDTKHNKQEYQFVPEFSKFFRTVGSILGGIDLEIQLTIHSNYLNRVLDSSIGILPFTRANGGAIGGVDPLMTTDILTVPVPVQGTTYQLNELKFIAWIEDNVNVSPVLNSHIYSHSTWAMQSRVLSADTTQYFDFHINKPITKFGFVFQNNTFNDNTQTSVSDFTGCPLYRRYDAGEANGEQYEPFRVTTQQSNEITSYEIVYGKHKLPYDSFSQSFTAIEDSTRLRAWMRALSYGNAFDLSGTYDEHANMSYKDGMIYIDSFPDIHDADQKYVRLKLTFSGAPSDLLMHVFYEYASTTSLNYDGTGNCVQVVPSH